MTKRAKKAGGDAAATPEFCAAQDFQAVLTKEQVLEFERHAAEGVGQARRIGLHTMSVSKADAVARFGDDPIGAGQVWIEIQESIDDYIKHLEAVLATMKTASIRAFCLAGTALHVADMASKKRRARHG